MPAETKQTFTTQDIKSIVEEYIKKHLTVQVSVSSCKEKVNGVTVQLLLDDVPFSKAKDRTYDGGY